MTSTGVPVARTAPGTPDRGGHARPRWVDPLGAGIVAGPALAVVSFAQIPFRPGFDITRHAFSFLLIGPGGWVQVVNYVVAGALYLLAGGALRRRMGGRLGRVARLAATGLGAGLVAAGLFPPPPSFGYPAGAPAGAPGEVTTNAVVHGIGFGLGVLSLCTLLLTTAVWLWRRSRYGWATAGAITALALLTVPPTSGVQPYGTLWLYAAVTAGYVVVSALINRIRTLTD